MKIGSIISNENGLYVITEIVNGQVVSTEKLEDYIIKNVYVGFDGSLRTLKEIVDFHCDKYISENQVIDRRDKFTWNSGEVGFKPKSEE